MITMVTIDELIQQGEEFISQFKKIPNANWRSEYCIANGNDSKYEDWEATSMRFIGAHYPNDKDVKRFEKKSTGFLSPENHSELLAILRAIRTVPQPNIAPMEGDRKGDVLVNNSNTVTQTQNTTVSCSIFIESLKDELTVRQFEELKEILEQYKETPETAKTKILEKLESFGVNVLASILASVICGVF